MQLARKLQVSQATVREALFQLEQAGLVVRVANKETIVTNLSATEVKERVAVRIALEGMACIEAARRMEKAQFVELENKLHEISRAIKENAYVNLTQADNEFHRYIWSQSGNEILAKTLRHVSTPLFAFAGLLLSGHHVSLKNVVNSHELIVDAMRAGKSRVIAESIREHVETSYHGFLNSGLLDFRGLAEQGKSR